MLHVSVKKTSTLMRVLVGVVSLFLLLLCVGCSMGADDGKLHDGYYREIAMTATEIKSFCHDNNIGCIIDAAHPFAENLHKAIEESQPSDWPQTLLSQFWMKRK